MILFEIEEFVQLRGWIFTNYNICALQEVRSIKNFNRTDLMFSLCGLNCVLCTMKLDGYCPGCGGGAGNQGCSIARCCIEHGGYQYCSECVQYPCDKYDDITKIDSFITHRNQISDMKTAVSIGYAAYCEILEQKAAILKALLENFNDGRRKTFYCLAVNLLELQDILTAIEKIKKEITEEMPLKEKASIAVRCFENIANQKGIILKLNKKPSKEYGN